MVKSADQPTESASFGGELSVRRQLATGLLKIGQAIRSHSWAGGESLGLTPTQGQILVLLLHRESQESRIGEIADELAIAQPTASVAVRSLVTKGFVEKSPSREDARAVALRLTAHGRELAERSRTWTDFLLDAVDELDPTEQAVFQRAAVKMIRSMQEKDQIPVSRMCATCTFFRPNAHPGTDTPHHCAYIDAPFSDRELRLDCTDYQPAPPDTVTALWAAYSNVGE